MKRIIGLIALLFITILAGYISVTNFHIVSFNFFGAWSLPLVLLLVFALTLGVLMGLLASLMVIFRTRAELRRMRKEVRVKEQEIENLRAIPFKEQS